jgi:hypothetical protein
MPKQLFLLKAGSFTRGNGTAKNPTRRWESKGGKTIVESDEDLARAFPEKFEKAPPDALPSDGKVGRDDAAFFFRESTSSPVPKEEEQAPTPAATPGDGLDRMTVPELEKLADEEEIDLSKAGNKADKVAAIRAARRGR